MKRYFTNTVELEVSCSAGTSTLILYPDGTASFCGYWGDRFDFKQALNNKRYLEHHQLNALKLAESCHQRCLAFCHHHVLQEN